MEELKKLNQNLQKLISRNSVLVNLLLKDPSEKQKLTTRQQIEMLSSMGLDYKEIAEIFGRSPSYIASELTQLKKKSKKEKAKGVEQISIEVKENERG